VAGRTASDAVKAFVEPIQLALTCFADGKVTTDSFKADTPGVLVFNRGEDVALNGAARVHLSVSMRYRVVKLSEPPLKSKPWKVSTTGWVYHLSDRDKQSIVEFHWHPELTVDVPFPHVHVASDAERRHYPTGRVLIEDVLNCAVECGAEPKRPRKWAAVCKANVENFGKGATWGSTHPAEL
jgi:hypothetical protein